MRKQENIPERGNNLSKFGKTQAGGQGLCLVNRWEEKMGEREVG